MATEKDFTRIKQRVERLKSPLRGAVVIGQAVGAVQDRHKMAEHFDLVIGEASFTFTRKTAAIAEEARLDGLYMLRTSLPKTQLQADATLRAYQSLAQVERAFRSLKTVDLALRSMFHWSAERVRAWAALHAGLLPGMARALIPADRQQKKVNSSVDWYKTMLPRAGIPQSRKSRAIRLFINEP